MVKYGAKKVTMTDISQKAVENAKANIQHFGLKNATARESDLFSNITGKVDCITFMQPYFAGNPPEGDTISASMLANPELIRRFLQEAKNHLNP
ncbi:MAG: methyltransferase [bacterium]